MRALVGGWQGVAAAEDFHIAARGKMEGGSAANRLDVTTEMGPLSLN